MAVSLTLGEKLRDERKNKKVTIKEVCRKIQISEGVLSDYENDKKKPGAEALTALALFYNISVDYLLGLSEVKHNFKDEINKEMGLSEDAMDTLRAITDFGGKTANLTLSLINSMLGDSEFMEEFRKAASLYCYMKEDGPEFSEEQIEEYIEEGYRKFGWKQYTVFDDEAEAFIQFKIQQIMLKFISKLRWAEMPEKEE